MLWTWHEQAVSLVHSKKQSHSWPVIFLTRKHPNSWALNTFWERRWVYQGIIIALHSAFPKPVISPRLCWLLQLWTFKQAFQKTFSLDCTQKASCMLTFLRHRWHILRPNTKYNVWLLGSVSLFFKLKLSPFQVYVKAVIQTSDSLLLKKNSFTPQFCSITWACSVLFSGY